MYTRPADPSFTLGPIAPTLTIALVLAAVGVLALGLLPAPILQWMQGAAF